MKNILKSSAIIVLICLGASSCTTSKKQNCDAYGSLAIEETTDLSVHSIETNNFKEEEI